MLTLRFEFASGFDTSFPEEGMGTRIVGRYQGGQHEIYDYFVARGAYYGDGCILAASQWFFCGAI